MPRSPLSLVTAGLLVGVLVGATAGVTGPAAAERLEAAVNGKPMVVQRSKNADKVDGRHAVGASTPPARRKGKLVATNGAGRLPNDIIAKAPDADRLDGVDSAAYRFIDLDLGAGIASDSSSRYSTNGLGTGGIAMNNSSSATIGWGFVLPPSFRSGASLRIRIQWHTSQTGCSFALLPNATSHDRVGLGEAGVSVAEGLSGPASVTSPSVAQTTTETVFTAVPTRPGTRFQAGDTYVFSLYRAAGSCTGVVYVTGASVTF
jgi:hypothetical protein